MATQGFPAAGIIADDVRAFLVGGDGTTAASGANPIPTTPVNSAGGTDTAFSSSATFTPAAASHLAGDCNGAAAEFTSMGPSAGRILITAASIRIDGGSAEATAWRLHLYNVTPPSALADDAVWDIASGDRASYLGYIDIGTAVDVGATQYVENVDIRKQVKLAGTSLFGYLVNLTTLTPAAVGHVVALQSVAL